jgi:two-component system CheB/CheR fusion protein
MPLPVPCRVLVVDDHPDTAESLARVIEAYGHEARYLTNPAAAQELINTFHPYVVLLDIAMPMIDGWTLARRIRQHPPSEHIKLVAVTAFGQPADHVKSREAGFDAHVQKPMDPAMVGAMLEQCFADPTRLPPPRR